ncbi:SLC25A34.2 family protein [Megaselia abdita]
MNSTRLGTYQTVTNLGWTKFDRSSPYQSPILCVFWGGAAGVFGSALGCPLYMIKTQIQAQSVGEYAVGYQHNHKSTIDALKNIVVNRGFLGLWRGFTGIVPRTAVGSSVQLSTFSMCKESLGQYDAFKDSIFLTAAGSAMISGFFTVVAMTPFDVVSTRLFNQGMDANGKGLLYNNLIDCFVKTFKVEGIAGLYKGFVANYWRAAPHTILNLTFWEQFKKWKRLYDEDKLLL